MNEKSHLSGGLFCVSRSDAADDLAGTEATRANVHDLSLAINDHMDALHIGSPAALGLAIGMADIISGHLALIADFTELTHSSPPPLQKSNGAILP